jgi:hypothetical protein
MEGSPIQQIKHQFPIRTLGPPHGMHKLKRIGPFRRIRRERSSGEVPQRRLELFYQRLHLATSRHLRQPPLKSVELHTPLRPRDRHHHALRRQLRTESQNQPPLTPQLDAKGVERGCTATQYSISVLEDISFERVPSPLPHRARRRGSLRLGPR